MNFQDLWNKFFLLFLGSCVIKKTCAFVVIGIGKKGCVGCRWDGKKSCRQCPFLLVCACVCGVEGGLGEQNQASNVALQTKY